MNAKLDIGWKQIKNMSWTVGFSLNVINNKEKIICFNKIFLKKISASLLLVLNNLLNLGNKRRYIGAKNACNDFMSPNDAAK